MKRIVVMNPKGGSGKTTIAINLAGYFASRQQKPVLMDFDPQGSSLRWVKKRQPTQAPIQVIAAFEKDSRTTRAFQLRVPEDSTHVIVDTPAACFGSDAYQPSTAWASVLAGLASHELIADFNAWSLLTLTAARFGQSPCTVSGVCR